MLVKVLTSINDFFNIFYKNVSIVDNTMNLNVNNSFKLAILSKLQ